ITLRDIDRAAGLIESFIDELDYSGFAANDMAISAVERQFITIGEAISRLHRIAPEVSARIPKMREIVDFRNVLTHGYDAIDHELVWRSANRELPALRKRSMRFWLRWCRRQA
ncbi:MAG: DUF86 domain-containing protein, partial [Rhodobacteraceae bacterium]|nr:DUF86 domain-containing protein [Paracoccaceae bacterium]